MSDRKRATKEKGESDSGVAQHERQNAGSGPTPPEAFVIHEVIRDDGERELKRSVRSLTWSALGAGLSMGFSFLTMAILASGLPNAPWTKLVQGFGYTIGFLIVVLGRQQLFTESTLTAVLPLLTRRNVHTLWLLARLWAVVLVANIVGTFLFAWLITRPEVFDTLVAEALNRIPAEAVKDPFWPMLTKAILAGWLIALMVWLLPGAGPSRLLLIIVITYVVAIAQFSHTVAGSVEAAFNVFTGYLSIGGYFSRFFVPTLIGNVIGGVSLVAILNHAPLRDELEEKGRSEPS